MTIFIIIIILLLIAFFVIYEVSIEKIETRHKAVLKRLVELEEKELHNKIIRHEFHFMKKYMKRYYPDAFKK